MDEDPIALRASAQKMLDDWRAAFDARFDTVVPQAKLLGMVEATTGEPFVEIATILGPCLSLAPEHAILQWIGQMAEYSANRNGVLYWRMPPEIDYYDFKLREEWMWGKDVIRVWKVYARLLISDAMPKRHSIQEEAYIRVGAVNG